MKIYLAAALLLFAGAAQAKVQARNVIYSDQGQPLEGYLAFDDAFKGKRPAVLIVHQWKGLGEYEKRRARMLAQMGYVAFAVDIYGKGVRPKSREEAGKQAGKYRADRALLRRRANAAVLRVRKMALVNPAKIAAMGYCFGGGTALELARSGAPIVGAASFHGNLDTPNPADAKNIQGKILVMHGAVDPNVSPESVGAFWREMSDAKVDMKFEAYGNAVHSFTEREAGNDPSKGSAYNQAADKRSWATFSAFLREIF